MRRKIYKEDIIAAGQELMFLRGYNDTGIKDITDKVSIPKGSFYNHFSSKEEFGLEVLQAYIKNGSEIHKNRLIDADKSPKQRILNFYDGMIEQYQTVLDFKLGCMMSNFSTEMADINENFRQLLQSGFDQQESIIIKCLKEAQAHGEIDQSLDCDLLGSSLLNGWHGALVRMKSTANNKPLKDFRKFFLDPLE